MRGSKKFSLILGLILSTLLITQDAFGQGNYPAHRGFGSRTGKNDAAAANGPGRGLLRWFRPNGLDNVGQPAVIDNLDAPAVVATGAWPQPADVTDEAFNPFVPFQYVDLDPLIFPAYRYAVTEPSLPGNDPTIPQNAANHRTWEWFFTPTDGLPRNYSLYVWLPIGSTNTLGGPVYTQRYFVYEILYGTGQRWIDVVDTYAAGTGWVRLGNGGSATNAMFAYDGVTPIRVILHNTIPRNEFGILTSPSGSVVYADAMRAVPQNGFYSASPIVAQFTPSVGPDVIHVVGARNEFEYQSGGQGGADTRGVIYSFLHDVTNLAEVDNTRWRFNAAIESEQANQLDNNSAGVVASAGWSLTNLPVGFRGNNYLTMAMTDVLASAEQVVYTPTLDDGDYDVYMWLQGTGANFFGENIVVEVYEGATLVDTLSVNADDNAGWLRLGTAKYTHVAANALSVRVTNLGTVADLGRQAYADAIRFVGRANAEVLSTPMHAVARVRNTLGGLPVATPVVISAAENGRIYCLEAEGDTTTRTTRLLWTYPSTPDPDNTGWTDPNHVAGLDGVGGVAEMPTSFDLSSAIIGDVGGEDVLFICSRNGRVYAINMDGRGDMDFALGKPGTTTRRWTYPDDFPSNAKTSNLGSFVGSPALVNDGVEDVLIVPTSQGRVYSIRAAGNPVAKTTTVKWAFPPVNQPTIGSVVATPAVEFGRIYIGTMMAGDRGTFFCLDLASGNELWRFDGTNQWDPLGLTFVNADNFQSSPVTIPAAEMVGMPDTVVVANDNRWITALDAISGALLWTTRELDAPVTAGLTYTPMTVYNNVGAYFVAPVVVVPTVDGRLGALFAEQAQLNVFGGSVITGNRLAWGFNLNSGGFTASIAVGKNFMYTADDNGNMLAFADSSAIGSYPGSPPGQSSVVPNDPVGTPYRNAKVRFVRRPLYDAYRRGTATYAQLNNPANWVSTNAFEWGETIYVLAFDYPYSADGTTARATQIEYRFSAEGAAFRNTSVRSKLATGAPSTDQDGYAVYQFPIQGSGANAMPPGSGSVTIGMNAWFSTGNPPPDDYRIQNVSLDPATARRDFAVANPIALVMDFLPGGAPDPNRSLGYTVNAGDPEALMNGTMPITSTVKLEENLAASIGLVPHNQRGNRVIGVVDRSMMTLLRRPGVGLDNVRVERADLAWMGGDKAIYKAIDPLRYPLFEDLPINYPNDSLDYPNISRQNTFFTKDKYGNAENPVTSAVTLLPPTNVDPNDPLTRLLTITSMDIDVNVPRFQPANLSASIDSAGSAISGGYLGNFKVFVDSDSNGTYSTRGRREAFRSFNTALGVPVDERIHVSTPSVDLGNLTQGTGYTPRDPKDPASIFSPWSGKYTTLFKPFNVVNEGNVNMLNMRVAKATDTLGTIDAWRLFSPANHERSWLDGSIHIWSDIDTRFAPVIGGFNTVLLQKPRVTDRNGTTLSANPIRRYNPLTGAVAGPLLNTALFPTGQPKIAVTIPVGTPVGSYSTVMQVIEDPDDNQALAIDGTGRALEIYSDPTFTLNFKVREGRLTNDATRIHSGTNSQNGPFIDGVLVGNENFLHQNVQPTAYRADSGRMSVVWASNRPAFGSAQPISASVNDQWRLYFATLDGNAPVAAPLPFPTTQWGNSPLNDLNRFSATNPNTRWFSQDGAAFPPAGTETGLFAPAAGETVLLNTVKFGSPSYPALGSFNPLSGAATTDVYLTFVGEAQKQSAQGRYTENRVFIAPVTMTGNGNAVSVGTPVGIADDPTMQKYKPTVVQFGQNATVFYTGDGPGKANLYYAMFNGTQFIDVRPGIKTRAIQLSQGMEQVGSVSANARYYEGANIPGLTAGNAMIELLFTGRLKGRTLSETFMTRIRVDDQGRPISPQGALINLPARDRERLERDSEVATFRSQGVEIDARQTLVLEQFYNGVYTNLEVAGTRQVDGQGLITFDSVLGGKVYIDTTLGKVRFSGGMPNRNAILLLSYTAKILRVSKATNVGHTTPSIVWDNRFTGEFDYWAQPGNTAINIDQPVRTGRYVFTYNRSAAGNGQGARPFMQTMRLGVQLTYPIHTQTNGVVTAINVAGNNSFYQVDPANGRVYFTDADENRTVTVTYDAVDPATGANLGQFIEVIPVGLIVERSEAPVPIDQAVNESQMHTFIDPFDFPNGADRRAGLIWMIWTSTRGGSPDLYFQTIAPKFAPKPSSK